MKSDRYITSQTEPDKYRIKVQSSTEGGRVAISIDGESPILSDAFEFIAPLGTDGPGITVRTVTQVELVPANRPIEQRF